MTQARYPFKNLESMTRVTRLLLAAAWCAAFVSTLVMFSISDLLDNSNRLPSWAAGAASFAESGRGAILLAVLCATLYGACTIAVLRWVYLANANVRALGAEGLRFAPGWAVGWYFVPLANLWKPYQAMKEIWQASATKNDWDEVKIPALLPWWWAFWLLSTSTTFSYDTDDPAERFVVFAFLLILFALWFGATFTLREIVSRIWAAQKRRHEAQL